MNDNFVVFSWLVRRNLKILRSLFKDKMINSCAWIGLQTILYGYFLPAFGMSQELIFPMYLGAIGLMFILIGDDRLFRDIADIQTTRYIDYEFTLPISKSWLCASYIATYMISLTIEVVLPVVLGAFIIASYVNLGLLSVGWLIGIHIASIFYCSLLFLTITFSFSFEWLLDNLWPRIFVPLFAICSVFYPLKNVEEVSPFFGKIFFLNPFTYIVEGFRGAFLGVGYSIHPAVCIGALILFSIIHVWLLHKALYIKMDPV
jgi:hypothetical protein